MDTESTAAAGQPKTTKKILCIEDERLISDLYTRALTRAGYDVTVVVDGRKGLEEAQTDAYDIILLDLMLPNMLGSDVLRRLTDRTETPKLHARIVIATNLEQADKTRAEIESKADAYIVKAEMTPKQLVEFLENLA